MANNMSFNAEMMIGIENDKWNLIDFGMNSLNILLILSGIGSFPCENRKQSFHLNFFIMPLCYEADSYIEF